MSREVVLVTSSVEYEQDISFFHGGANIFCGRAGNVSFSHVVIFVVVGHAQVSCSVSASVNETVLFEWVST